MKRLRSTLRHAGLVLGTGYVLCFFSETFFWSLWRPDEEPQGRILQWLFYSLLAYLTLAAIRYFRVGDIWGLVLAGALYGWLGEGVFAMTVFGDPSMPFPITVAWTALAWHAPISVVVGWYALGRALRQPGRWPTALLSIGLGIFWGVWGFGWMAETPPVGGEPIEFLVHALVTTALLAFAHRAIAAGHPARFAPSRIGLGLAGAAVLAFFVLVTVPAVPVAPIVLPPLLGLLALVLFRYRAGRPEGCLIETFEEPILWRNLAVMALMPLTAWLIYGLAIEALPPLAAIHLTFAGVTILGGTAVFAVAVPKAIRRRI